jgi:hypothetical protein
MSYNYHASVSTGENARRSSNGFGFHLRTWEIDFEGIAEST